MNPEELNILEICKKKLGSELIGFEEFIEKIVKIRTNAAYPPFNIECLSENRFKILVAVAGFHKDDLKIKLEGMQLCILGNQKETPAKEYIYKGIANRSFQKSFLLADGMSVTNVNLANGLLEIEVFKPASEDRSIEIPIGYTTE